MPDRQTDGQSELWNQRRCGAVLKVLLELPLIKALYGLKTPTPSRAYARRITRGEGVPGSSPLPI